MHNKVDIGMRDYEGNFINAKTTSFPSSLQVKEGEAFDLLQGAFDLLQGIKWIGELSLNNVKSRRGRHLIYYKVHLIYYKVSNGLVN